MDLKEKHAKKKKKKLKRELQLWDRGGGWAWAHSLMEMCGGVKAEKEVYISVHLKAQWESSSWQWEGKMGERERIDSDGSADILMLINLSWCIINSVKYLWINHEQDDEGVFAPVVQPRKTLLVFRYVFFVVVPIKGTHVFFVWGGSGWQCYYRS